jgi:hypothetical protein
VASGDDERTGSSLVALNTWLVLGLAFILVLGLFSLRLTYRPDVPREEASRQLPPQPEPLLRPPPELDEEIFPCSDCHEGEEVDRRRRELDDEHDDIELVHGDLWCLSCHDTGDSDMLQLADTTPVGFEESWRLCTQCHGEKLPDWRAGVHGKRTGHWWGPKEYLNCVSCHDAHSPAFDPIEPKPPPTPPSEIVWKARAPREEPSDEGE